MSDFKSREDLLSEELPTCDWRTIFTAAEVPFTPAQEATFDSYFGQFLPSNGGKCCTCGAIQGANHDGSIPLGITPAFRWSSPFDGFCSRCGYPARAVHIFGSLEIRVILQWHPLHLTESVSDAVH